MRPSNNLENKNPSDTYWRVELVFEKVQAHSSLSPPMKYNQNQSSLMTSLSILGVTEILCSFRLVLEEKTGKEIPKSSRLEFLEKFLANNFAVSDVEDNTFGPLNRVGISNLPLLRTILAICQKSWQPSFWDVMNSFVLLGYASLVASRTLLQQLLACLNFNLDSEDLFCWCIQKK